MYTSTLCPVYQKWLQLNPQQARKQRLTVKAQALQQRYNGNLEKALELYHQVWEIARSVLLALRQPDNQSKEFQQDLIAFVTVAIEIEQCCQSNGDSAEKDGVIASTEQQLSALLPLYASEPSLFAIIYHLKTWIAQNRYFQQPLQVH